MSNGAQTPAGEFRSALMDFIRREAQPVDKYGHQPRLYALTRQIGTGMFYDDDVVFAAAWLHDLGVFVGHRPEDPEQLARWDHVAYAIGQAPAILKKLGFTPAKIPAVLNAIREHLPSAEPGSLEATILRDADILEQLGAIGILRAAAKVGRDTRFPTFTAVTAALEKALNTLPSQIRLHPARTLAEPRIRALREFLASLQHDSLGELH